ncbi:MAG: coproporphyrinogen III oxidase family protein, partial [Firmicutes bacterium]|nr:coproporphyrinogen III oxidase family protein [Bacillota bacterium]
MTTSLYIHIPFCDKKCNYCNFISFVENQSVQHEYVAAVIKELESYKWHILKTIYIGGGTPSVLYNGAITQIFEIIRCNFELTKDCEITIEVNPNSLTQQKIDEYKKAGVNRVSVGVQSFNNKTLEYLGRLHTSGQAINAIELLQKNNITNINVDIIYGVENDDLKTTLNTLLKLNIPHVSAYSLIYEPNTKFENSNQLDDEIVLGQQRLIEENLKAIGI